MLLWHEIENSVQRSIRMILYLDKVQDEVCRWEEVWKEVTPMSQVSSCRTCLVDAQDDVNWQELGKKSGGPATASVLPQIDLGGPFPNHNVTLTFPLSPPSWIATHSNQPQPFPPHPSSCVATLHAATVLLPAEPGCRGIEFMVL